ncbi:response regulator [Deinococcus sp. QL22]|uniref:response regulator n=1 Tax=Deinococcus sp. QL22 TaxID=2939437 RepID=UPI0020177C41|nr:response regulator [Deinococcus sp. QL22]UQN08232.1 response regulator [Deinococcus sp. QL22]
MIRPLRVLLVDDNPLDRQLAQAAFELLDAPCHLETVESGTAALKLLLHSEARLPDVILLDIHMPGMTGFEVLSALKAQPRLGFIPVMMLTTSAHDDDITRAYTLHASAYLTKSNDFHTFLEQIEKCIGFWAGARLPDWSQMISV